MEAENYFCVGSKPIEVCRFFRSERCGMGGKEFEKALSIGNVYHYECIIKGYKLHAVCGLSGVIRSFVLTKACVLDIHYLKDVKADYSYSYSNCTIIGDGGYISAQGQLGLSETVNIILKVPYRCNQERMETDMTGFC